MAKIESTARIAAFLFLSNGASACEAKAHQCNRLVEVANAQQEQIAQTMARLNSAAPDPAQLETIAAAFDQSLPRIAAVQVKDTRLTALSVEFQTNIRQFGTIVRGMAAAARANNQDAYNELVPQVQQTSTRFSSTIDRINGYCSQ